MVTLNLLKLAVGMGMVGGAFGANVQDAIEAYDRILPELAGLGEDDLNELFRFHMRCLVGLGRPGQGMAPTPTNSSSSENLATFDPWWVVSATVNLAVLAATLCAAYYMYSKKRSEDTLGQFKETKTIYRPPPKVVSMMTKDRRETLALMKASGIVSAEEEYAREKVEDAEMTGFYAMQYKCREGAVDVMRSVNNARTLQRVGRGFMTRLRANNIEQPVEEVVVIPPLPVFSRIADDDYLLDTSRSLNDTYGSIMTDPVETQEDEDDLDHLATPLKTTFRLPEDENLVVEAFAEQFTPVDLVTPKKEVKPLRRFTATNSAKKENTGRRFTTPNTTGRKSSIRRPSILKTPLTARRRSSVAVKGADKMEQDETKTRDTLRFQYLGERHTIEVNFRKGRKRIHDTLVASSSMVPRPHKEYKSTFNTFSRLAETSTRSVSMKTRKPREEKPLKKKLIKKPKSTSGKVLKCLTTDSTVTCNEPLPVSYMVCPVLSAEESDDDVVSFDDNACFLDGTVTPPVKCNKVELIIPCEPPVLEEEDDEEDDILGASRRFSVTFSDLAEDCIDFERIGTIIDQLETPRKRRASTFKPETLAGKVDRLLALTDTSPTDVSMHGLELAVATRNISDIIRHLRLRPEQATKALPIIENGSPHHASPPRHM